VPRGARAVLRVGPVCEGPAGPGRRGVVHASPVFRARGDVASFWFHRGARDRRVSKSSDDASERRSTQRISHQRVDGVLARPRRSLPETSPPGRQLISRRGSYTRLATEGQLGSLRIGARARAHDDRVPRYTTSESSESPSDSDEDAGGAGAGAGAGAAAAAAASATAPGGLGQMAGSPWYCRQL